MLFICCLFGVAFSLPTPDHIPHEDPEFIPIISENRFDEPGGYSFDFETGNGIIRSEAGQADETGQLVSQQGEYSYTAPDGTLVTLKFVANENGFQPESPFLPVAPLFPHPIPDFVLEQIERARIEDEEAAKNGVVQDYVV